MRLSSFDIIKFPLVTEKTTILSEQGKYVFAVDSGQLKMVLLRLLKIFFQ